MIKMTVREGLGAFQGIDKLPKLKDGKVDYNIGYIGSHLEAAVVAFQKRRDKLQREMSVEYDHELEEEVSVEENGKTVRRMQKTGKTERRMKIPEVKLGEFTEKIEEMLEAEFEINRDPIKYSAAFPPVPAGLSKEDLAKYEEKYPTPSAAQLRPLVKIIVMDD